MATYWCELGMVNEKLGILGFVVRMMEPESLKTSSTIFFVYYFNFYFRIERKHQWDQ
jgi:hypothetical protein